MFLTKLTDKSLVTNQDLAFNQRIGLPVEVYCSRQGTTLAFGKIEMYTDHFIYVSGRSYCRENHMFFGHPHLSA
ncbi:MULTISPECIES: hypothetical protein [Alkalihalophilus]|jgi:hypothetical protein|uniref:Uncharacterized protein n=3 Tax=Alkalihalophilus TaxID=2893060 RepID=D3G008_ALKPO|nr:MULTISPECIES: hypothetical protein [Alkalihalophilus]ADC51093.1 hypothetical protein BpOF4_15220 [Alkalihalophilus pseudofirmus OF4]ERN54137.1 hypothetical protein A33I_06855 [Alkalihalophilus marmarensis DSM 21297]MCM3488440.1 hypothetical protein [Alkalihalophilus marmarensis]MDV2884287.1 hypothetical protein [Alkalihalophilus pseudofirmus]MEC2070776.1 hypothetical protein [Alkalihalophilus marmarensis]